MADGARIVKISIYVLTLEKHTCHEYLEKYVLIEKKWFPKEIYGFMVSIRCRRQKTLKTINLLWGTFFSFDAYLLRCSWHACFPSAKTGKLILSILAQFVKNKKNC